MNKTHLLAACGAALLWGACSNSVDFGEQYKKEVYIVNSKEALHYEQHEAGEASRGNISVYVTGTKLPNKDIRVDYEVNTQALDDYNRKEYGDRTDLYFTAVPQNLCTFSSPDITIRKGEPYGCLEFTINTLAFSPEKTYILPLSIVGANGAEVSESLHTILYVVRINNAYAGSYISTCKVGGTGRGDFNKKAVAVSAQKILLPLAAQSNTSSSSTLSYDTDYYQLTIAEDNSLTVEPYLQSVIYPDETQQSYYDPEERIFYIHYFMEDKYGERIAVYEVLKAI